MGARAGVCVCACLCVCVRARVRACASITDRSDDVNTCVQIAKRDSKTRNTHADLTRIGMYSIRIVGMFI